jgi:hypothetical protein
MQAGRWTAPSGKASERWDSRSASLGQPAAAAFADPDAADAMKLMQSSISQVPPLLGNVEFLLRTTPPFPFPAFHSLDGPSLSLAVETKERLDNCQGTYRY